MRCLREHIHGQRLRERIAALREQLYVARERARITGDVDDPRRPHGHHRANGLRVHTFARGIDHNAVRPDTAPGKLCRSRSGISAEKFRIFHAVSLCVPACVLDRFRNDLCPDDVRGFSCQAQADGSGTAVQVQNLIRRCVDGIFYRTLIQPLGLHGIDLIKRLRRERKRQPTEPVSQFCFAPERIKISCEYNVALLLIHIEHNAGQLRAMLTQVTNQIVRLRAKAARRDNAQYGVLRVHGAAREQMPHRTPGRWLPHTA